MPPDPHTCDSLSHPRGEHALWAELCQARAKLAAAYLEITSLRRTLADASEELDTARRLLAEYRDDLLRSLPCP